MPTACNLHATDTMLGVRGLGFKVLGLNPNSRDGCTPTLLTTLLTKVQMKAEVTTEPEVSEWSKEEREFAPSSPYFITLASQSDQARLRGSVPVLTLHITDCESVLASSAGMQGYQACGIDQSLQYYHLVRRFVSANVSFRNHFIVSC